MNIELALANLKRHGFDAVYFDTAAQAAEYVAGELKGMSVGIGGRPPLRSATALRMPRRT